MKNRFVPLCLGVVLSTLPVPGFSSIHAQEPLSVRLVPRAGLTSPDAYFYEEFANFADDDPTEWTNGSLGRAFYLGVAVEAGYEDRGIFVRGELAHTFEGWLSVLHGIIRPRVLFDPPEIIYTALDVPASLTFATLQIIFPAQFEAAGIRPYGLVGGGGKWYHFGAPTESNTVEAILPNDGFTPTLELGAGATFSLFGLTFDIQARDDINKYWDKTQHDLVFSGGIQWTLWGTK